MKKLMLNVALGALMTTGLASAQDQTAGTIPASLSTQQQSYSANNIKVLGEIMRGQTSPLINYTRPGEYRAYIFEGTGHDLVDITLAGPNRNAVIALADQTLAPIAKGVGHVSAELPYHGPDAEAFYILVKSDQPGRFFIHFKQIPATAEPADATR